MSYLPKEPKDPKKISTNRVILWIVVAGIGVYSIIQGVIAIAANGGK